MLKDKFWFVATKCRAEQNEVKKAKIAKIGAKVMSEICGSECFVHTFATIVSDDILLQNFAIIQYEKLF